MEDTIRKKPHERIKSLLRRAGVLTLAPALLLCALCLVPDAHAAGYQYMLEVATGVSTGDEKNVEFFIITYATAGESAEELNSILLFPHGGSLKESCAA